GRGAREARRRGARCRASNGALAPMAAPVDPGDARGDAARGAGARRGSRSGLARGARPRSRLGPADVAPGGRLRPCARCDRAGARPGRAAMSARARPSLPLARRLLAQARPYWIQLACILVLDFAAVPLALLAPVPLKIAIDSAIGDHPLPWPLVSLGGLSSATAALAISVGLVLGIALLTEAQKYLTCMLPAYTGERLVLEFRAALFGHVQRLSLAYHDTRGTADSIYRVQYDAPAIQWIAAYGISPFLTAGMTLVGMIVVTARLDAALALVALAVLPVLTVLI